MSYLPFQYGVNNGYALYPTQYNGYAPHNGYPPHNGYAPLQSSKRKTDEVNELKGVVKELKGVVTSLQGNGWYAKEPEDWNKYEVAKWIVTINDGAFKRYTNLTKNIIEEEILGKDLTFVNGADWKRLGITRFRDIKLALHSVGKLKKRGPPIRARKYSMTLPRPPIRPPKPIISSDGVSS